MSAADRWAHREAHPRKDYDALTRVQLVARLETVTDCLHRLWVQAELDGGPLPRCIGAMKVEVSTLRQEIQRLDRIAREEADLTEPLEASLAFVQEHGRLPRASEVSTERVAISQVASQEPATNDPLLGLRRAFGHTGPLDEHPSLTDAQKEMVRERIYFPLQPGDKPVVFDHCRHAITPNRQCDAVYKTHRGRWPVCKKHERVNGVPFPRGR